MVNVVTELGRKLRGNKSIISYEILFLRFDFLWLTRAYPKTSSVKGLARSPATGNA